MKAPVGCLGVVLVADRNKVHHPFEGQAVDAAKKAVGGLVEVADLHGIILS